MFTIHTEKNSMFAYIRCLLPAVRILIGQIKNSSLQYIFEIWKPIIIYYFQPRNLLTIKYESPNDKSMYPFILIFQFQARESDTSNLFYKDINFPGQNLGINIKLEHHLTVVIQCKLSWLGKCYTNIDIMLFLVIISNSLWGYFII